MSGKIDKAKGRAKKAVGEIKGDPEMKDRGRIDKATGKVKDTVGGAGSKAKKAHRKIS
jgi:uncharacterized protein YjbJ (UPF0337 family)